MMKTRSYYVYILRCQDNSLYSGITTCPYRRLAEHKMGKGGAYTHSHGAVDMECLWLTNSRNSASILEYALKQLTKTQKEKLVVGIDLHTILPELPHNYRALGKDYLAMLKNADNYFAKDKILHIDMSEALSMGVGEILCADSGGVVMYLFDCDNYFISSASESDFERLFGYIDKDFRCIVVHHDFEIYKAKQLVDNDDCVLEIGTKCYNVAYLKKSVPARNLSVCDIRPAKIDDLEQIAQEYQLYDATDEISELIQSGDMLCAYKDDTLVGFVGFHPEGAMGLLQVLPQYRRQGISRELTIALMEKVIKDGHIPFAQVIYTNIPSIEAQKKFGFVFSEPTVTWMHKINENNYQ